MLWIASKQYHSISNLFRRRVERCWEGSALALERVQKRRFGTRSQASLRNAPDNYDLHPRLRPIIIITTITITIIIMFLLCRRHHRHHHHHHHHRHHHHHHHHQQHQHQHQHHQQHQPQHQHQHHHHHHDYVKVQRADPAVSFCSVKDFVPVA